MRKRLRQVHLVATFWLTACNVVDFSQPGTSDPESIYAATYPYYAEFCALSQIKQRQGFGAEIRGEIGGHAVLYLNGACRSTGTDRQVLVLCGEMAAEAGDGVGISMNEHYRNAKWVAVPGREFFFNGNLLPGESLTRDRYRAVLAEASHRGLYDGVEFHPGVFDTSPPSTSPEEYKYDVSIATDFAISLGRGRYCARVPVTRPQLLAMIDFLNGQNEPYRSGRQEFRWSLFQDNCIHLAHNALSAAGVWKSWATNRGLLISLFDFPVPKNEFVNLVRRTNNSTLLDPVAIWHDVEARQTVLQFGQLPVRPGALAMSWPAHTPNFVYETALKLVFYDEPHFGPYRGWLGAILADPRRLDMERNLADFAIQYRRLRAARKPLAWWLAQDALQGAEPGALATFYTRYYAALDMALADTDRRLMQMRRYRAARHLTVSSRSAS